MNKRTAGDRVFGVIVTLILILCAVIALVPLISVQFQGCRQYQCGHTLACWVHV